MGCPLSKNHRKGLCELECVFCCRFFIAFLIVSSIIAITFHLLLCALVSAKSCSLSPTYNNICELDTHVCGYVGRSNLVPLMFY